MDSTIIQQGKFTSTGAAKTLSIRSDVDWIEVINDTQFATQQTPGRGVKFEWQRGMAAGAAFEYSKADGTDSVQAEKVTSGGFTLIDPNAGASAPVTGTTITTANPPVCTAANHGFENGDTVVLTNLTNMPQISGATAPFTIGNVTTNTFELTYFDTSSANFTAEVAFTARSIPFFTWTGGWSNISSVTVGSTTQVQMTTSEAEEAYAVGTVLKFNIDPAFGMVELSGLSGTILSYDSATNTYTLDIDSTGFTPFAYPAASAVPFVSPTAVVVGTTGGVNSDRVTNVSDLKIKLGAGIDGPAGSSADVIYWRAGKSFSVSNS